MSELTDKQKQAMKAARDRTMAKFTPEERERIKDVCAGLTRESKKEAFAAAPRDIRNVICLGMDEKEEELAADYRQFGRLEDQER